MATRVLIPEHVGAFARLDAASDVHGTKAGQFVVSVGHKAMSKTRTGMGDETELVVLPSKAAADR